MLRLIYEKIILANPLKTIFVFSFLILFLALNATKLQIDASADSLLLQDDSDLLFTRNVSQQFGMQDILVIAFAPNDDLLSDATLSSIDALSADLLKLDRVASVNSILNVPLLQSSHAPVKELIKNIPTLQTGKVDIELAKKEFLSSPLYAQNLVSKDLKTTAIVINLKDESSLLGAKSQSAAFKQYQRDENHEFIKNIRAILAKYNDKGSIFLGGVNMVADDLITFVKSDLGIYGVTLLSLLIFVLWLIFRETKWIFIPILICVASILSTAGLLGLFGWQVTVISSNFVSLQLIITLSIILHLIVRYRELSRLHPHWSQKNLVLETMLSKAMPSFLAILTTIIGFSSLVFSNILPIINLGLMMSSGIAISLFLSFILFPTMLVMMPTQKPFRDFEQKFALTKVLASWVEKYGKGIIVGSILIVIFSLSGASKLIVENSFINYFKQSTEIYQGMKMIDENLGGTTPLDIIVKFKEKAPAVVKEVVLNDSFASFEDEFMAERDENQYWFTPNKMQKILEIHDYLVSKNEIGNVQSLATLLKIGKQMNNGEPLDNFSLALLYNKLPQDIKKIILEPYLDITENTVRFATRIKDSNPNLRRADLLEQINQDLDQIVQPEIGTYRLSNLMVLYNNMLQSLFESQILTLSIVLFLLFMMFVLIFRSLSVALISIVANIVPIGIIFGFMGWLHIPLDLMTITIAAISLGIGVDDTIHYVYRYREELLVDGDYLAAMKRAHNSIGFAMYYTSFAIMLGFSVLTLSNFLPTIYFGSLTVLVMLMSLLGALLLLPRLFIIFKPFK